MRGRKPQPTVLKILHGRPSHNPLPKNEPKPVGALEAPPDWFSESQREGWLYAMAHAPVGVLRRIDRGTLAAYIVAEDFHRRATMAQNRTALLVRVKTWATSRKPKPKPGETEQAAPPEDEGLPMVSPYLHVINAQAKIMIKAAEQLGFTPASRPRLANAGPMPSAPGVSAIEPRRTLDEYLDAAPEFPKLH